MKGMTRALELKVIKFIDNVWQIQCEERLGNPNSGDSKRFRETERKYETQNEELAVLLSEDLSVETFVESV